MSALTAESLRRHYAFTMAGDRIHRTEQYKADFDAWLAERDAEVEAAVRAQIAANIEAARHQFVRVTGTVPSHPVVSAYDDAVRIAKGGAS